MIPLPRVLTWPLPAKADVLLAIPVSAQVRAQPQPEGWPFGLRWVQLISVGLNNYPPWLLRGPLVTTAHGTSSQTIADFALACVLQHALRLPDRRVGSPEVVLHRAAAADVARRDQRDAETVQHPGRRRVDLRGESPLHAAFEHGHSPGMPRCGPVEHIGRVHLVSGGVAAASSRVAAGFDQLARGVDRRQFRRNGLVGVASVYSATQLDWSSIWESAIAEAAEPMQKSIVCIFLNGGNDGLNTIVPVEPSEFAAYQAARTNIARVLGPSTGTQVGTTILPGTGAPHPEQNRAPSKVDPVVKTKNHCIFNASEKEFRLSNGNLSGFSTGVDIPGCPVVQ